MAPPSATIAIVSIGEMGMGIAKLLKAHQYRVVTNVSDRSEATRQRASEAGIDLVDSYLKLLECSDYVLSIVPPRDALSTAERFITAYQFSDSASFRGTCYVDLNAISPASATRIAKSFSTWSLRFLDGGIIGGAPQLQSEGVWSKPSIVVSGPTIIDNKLAEVLNVTHIATTIGRASGLKMCFASMTKGLTAIAIQSFTTAHKLGVLEQLQSHLKKHSPKTGELAARGLVGMPPKAYRWVDEMQEIAASFRDDGGFEPDMFNAVSEVYRFVADETDLGMERTEERRVGKTPEDVARLVAEGLKRKKEKLE